MVSLDSLFDSLLLDLIFDTGAEIDPEVLLEALGGQDVAAGRKILDPDMQDPMLEMQLSPSMPFRRRGERRLLIFDDSSGPLFEDPESGYVVQLDLRPEKERLLGICDSAPVRMGRISLPGGVADAVIAARSAVDLRAICLLPWVLDPTLDIDGKKRANRLTQPEFEAKIAAYEKRLEELTEAEILANLGSVKLERHGDFLVVDCLEADGTWDVRTSLEMKQAIAAIERFSLIPGAPSGGRKPPPSAAAPASKTAAKEAKPAPEVAEPAPSGPPLTYTELGNRLLLIFPAERFDLDVAAALGKRDFDAVVRRGELPGVVRDRIHENGAEFIAPLEFLSEVFIDGTPLSRPVFEQKATTVSAELRTLEVHCPRFGPVLLLDLGGRGRYISSLRSEPERLAQSVS